MDSPNLSAALAYAQRYGWAVFPVYEVVNGRCACPRGVDCGGNTGKHPRTAHGVSDASRDLAVIRAWWERWPSANIGLACGEPSGVWVLDLDVKENRHGRAWLEDWEEHEAVIETLSQVTGSGGLHLFFKLTPDADALGNHNNVYPGVDVKVTGGYVLLPPSENAAGPYAWERQVEPVEAPGVLVADLRRGIGGSRRRGTGVTAAWDDMKLRRLLRGEEAVPEGQRNETMISLAGWLFRTPLYPDRQQALELFVRVNETACHPPLPEDELRKILESSARYIADEREQLPDWQPEDGAEEDPGPPREVLPLTDEGNAQRFVRRWGENVRYTAASGWLTWDGRVWVPDVTEESVRMAREVALAIRDELHWVNDDEDDAPPRRALLAWAQRSQSQGRLAAMLTLARTDASVMMRWEDFDADRPILVCENGVLELELREGVQEVGDLHFSDHRRGDYSTRYVNAPWDPDEVCPSWQRFLDDVMPDPQVQAYLQRAVGYTLSGRSTEKCLFILHGDGNNGKSVFVNFLQLLLGAYATSLPASTLIHKHSGGGAGHDLLPLKGARMAVASETNEGERLDVRTVKQITGGDDRIKARDLYKSWVEFRNRAVVWLMTNHRPGVRDFSSAIWSRIKLVPFEVTVTEDARVPMDVLRDRFWSERAGILRWAVEGWLDWTLHGLREPERVRVAVSEYRHEEDWLARFMEDCCELGEVFWVPASELYECYKSWANESGEYVHTQTKFGRELGRMPELQRLRDSRGTGYVGVKLNAGWLAKLGVGAWAGSAL